MLFSRFIFVSSALFAGSAAAFSVQPSSAMPKTALYASSSDNEGVVDRRQVFASIAATAAAFGASSAYALDLSVGKAANIESGKALDQGMDLSLNTGMGDRPNDEPGQSMKKGESLGKSMNDQIGIGNAAQNVKTDVKKVAEGVNPFTSNEGKMDKNMGMSSNNLSLGMGGDNAADRIKGNAQEIEKNTGAGNKVASKVQSDVDTVSGNKGFSLPNPFSGGNDMGKNMGKGMDMGKNMGMNRPNDEPGQSMKKGEQLGQNMGGSIGAGKALDNVTQDLKQVASGQNVFTTQNK